MANEAHIYCGRLDPPLSPQGEAEVRLTALSLGYEFDRVVVSESLRARQTASIICPGIKPEIVSALNEISFGDFEGLNADEIAQRMPQHWARYLEDPLHFWFPGGDNAGEYLMHASDMAQTLAQSEGRVLVISHKGFITAALSTLLQGDASCMFCYDIRPAGFVRLSVTGGCAVLTQLF